MRPCCLPTVCPVARAQRRALPAAQPSGSARPPLLQTPVPGEVSGDSPPISPLGREELLSQAWGRRRVEGSPRQAQRLSRFLGMTPGVTPGQLCLQVGGQPALLPRAPDSLLPPRLCCSPSFVLDTWGGSPAEVSLPFPTPPPPLSQSLRNLLSRSRTGRPCPLVDTRGMATNHKPALHGPALPTSRMSLPLRLGTPRPEAVSPPLCSQPVG